MGRGPQQQQHLRHQRKETLSQNDLHEHEQDRLLRGQELPGSLLGLQQRLRRHVLLHEQVPLLQGGAWLLHGLRPHQLPGQPVLLQEGRVRRLHEHVRHERLHQVLPHGPLVQRKLQDEDLREGELRRPSYEMMDDCDNIMDRYRMSNCMSCHVMDGHWLMYEQPNYRGRMMYFRPGEYRNFQNMGSSGGMRFMSMKRIMDSCY